MVNTCLRTKYVAMLNTCLRTKYVAMLNICLRTKFQLLNCSVLLITSVEPEAKENGRSVTMLFDVLQKYYPYKSCVFLQHL
jgi:hypothetical protein